MKCGLHRSRRVKRKSRGRQPPDASLRVGGNVGDSRQEFCAEYRTSPLGGRRPTEIPTESPPHKPGPYAARLLRGKPQSPLRFGLRGKPGETMLYYEKERKKIQRSMGQDPYLDTPS